MKKSPLALGLAVLAAGLTLGVPPAAQASAALLELQQQDVAEEKMSDESWVDEQGFVRLSLAELEDLSAVQSSEEISGILASGEPVNLLLDESNEVIAVAVAQKTWIAPRAISTCFSGGSIIKRYVGVKAETRCYTGTGTLDVNLPSVYYLAPGGFNITMYVSGGSIPSSTVSWNTSSVTYKTPLNVYQLKRWAKA